MIVTTRIEDATTVVIMVPICVPKKSGSSPYTEKMMKLAHSLPKGLICTLLLTTTPQR